MMKYFTLPFALIFSLMSCRQSQGLKVVIKEVDTTGCYKIDSFNFVVASLTEYRNQFFALSSKYTQTGDTLFRDSARLFYGKVKTSYERMEDMARQKNKKK